MSSGCRRQQAKYLLSVQYTDRLWIKNLELAFDFFEGKGFELCWTIGARTVELMTQFSGLVEYRLDLLLTRLP